MNAAKESKVSLMPEDIPMSEYDFCELWVASRPRLWLRYAASTITSISIWLAVATCETTHTIFRHLNHHICDESVDPPTFSSGKPEDKNGIIPPFVRSLSTFPL